MNANPKQVARSTRGSELIDWRAVLRQMATSRALDDLEESTLLPERKVLYQFSARGHDLTQVLLSRQLTGAQDGVGAYYRSRPLLLGLGLPLEDALASTMMRAGGMSDGRDIGVVFNMPRKIRCLRAAGVRRRRHSVHARGGLGSGPALSRRGARREGVRGQHCRGAWRRCIDGHQWLLGGSQYRDHRAAAASVLHRGQRLRHFGAVAAADSGRQHRAKSRKAFAACACSRAMPRIRWPPPR